MWNRRRVDRARYQDLQQVVAGARAAAQEAQQVAEKTAQDISRLAQAAERSAASARVAAVSATQAVSHEESSKRGTKGPWEILYLLSFCAYCLVLAVTFARLVPPAFTDPSPNEIYNSGAVEVAIAGPGDGGQASLAAKVVIEAEYYYSDRDRLTDYTISFPGQYRNDRFLVILEGSATLSRLEGFSGKVRPQQVVQQVLPDLSVHPPQRSCSAPFGAALPPDEVDPCQVIDGTVPQVSFNPDACAASGTRLPSGYVSVELTGQGQTGFESDWAHRVLNLPDFNPSGGPEQDSRPLKIDIDGNVAANGDYLPVQASGCKDLSVTSDWRIGSTFDEPTSTLGEIQSWEYPNGTKEINVVFKKRNAEATGNELIIFAGLLGALSIGFMPIAYDACRDALAD